MPSLGSLFYTIGLQDLTDKDLQKINDKLKNVGSELRITPKLVKSVNEILPKGVKIELDPQLKAVSNEAIAKAVEGKVMRVEVAPLLTSLRKNIADATKGNPAEVEVGIQSAKLRTLIESVLRKHGFMLNISTVNDNYTKLIQQKLNGTTYKIRVHADVKEISRNIQTSLAQMQSRYFGLKVSRDVLYRSIDEALGQHRFPINIVVNQDQARQAVQSAVAQAQPTNKGRVYTAQDVKNVQSAMDGLANAHSRAASAAKSQVSSSEDLASALLRNINISGELQSAFASMFSLSAAKEFLAQVVEIGGELEHQKIAMDTIFGDKGKTNELFGQIKGLARNSPFGVMELSKSVKALSAYGVEYNEIYDTAKRLADISAATSVDINRLILAFGKTRSRGFLDGLEAKQFAYANIPIYEMVRQKLEELEGQAVTTAEVMSRIQKREIGFDLVKDVLWDITDPGGKFYDMQEALAGSVKTSWKLVRDNIELMFGDMAESSIGDGLKWLAQLLQQLTQRWEIIGKTMAVALSGLGLYKVALMAANTLLGKTNLLTISAVQAENAKTVAIAKSATAYRTLTSAETDALAIEQALKKTASANLIARKKLTSADIEQLYVSNAINRDSLMRLAATGRLEKGTLRTALSTKLLTRADLAYLIQLRKTTTFMGIHGKTAAALALRFKLLGKSIATALAPVWKMIANPATLLMAGFGAGFAIWERYKGQLEAAKEIGEQIQTKASEGYDNLVSATKEMSPSIGLDTHQLEQGIEKLEQTIKDYSSTPVEDMNNALVAQDGHVRTLAERYDVLLNRVHELAKAYQMIDVTKLGEMVTNATNDTNGWFNDSVIENAKDYSEALKDYDKGIREYARTHKEEVERIVNEAKKNNREFAEEIKDITTLEGQWVKLFSGQRHGGKAVYGGFASEAYKLIKDNSFRTILISAAGSFYRDADKFIATLTTEIESKWNTSINNLSKTQKDALAISLQSMLDQAEGVSDTVKMEFATMLENAFGVTIIEDKIGPALKDTMKTLATQSTDGQIAAVVLKWRNEGFNKLSDAEKKVVKDLMNNAKNDVMSSLALTQQKMADYLKDHPLEQVIGLVYSETEATPLQKSIWESRPQVQKLLTESNPVGIADNDKAGQLTDSAQKRRTWYNSWTKSGNYYDTRSAIKADLEQLDNEIRASKNATAEYKKAKEEEFKAKKELAEAMGFGDIELNDKKSNSPGSEKDTQAEQIKHRVEILKKAYAEYKKILDLTGNAQVAFAQIKDSGIFDELFVGDNAIQNFNDYKGELQKLLSDVETLLQGIGENDPFFKGRHDLAISLRTILNLEIPTDEQKKAIDKAKSELDALADKISKQWNLYNALFEQTGNKTYSANIAFGGNVAFGSEIEQLQSVLNEKLKDKGLEVPLSLSIDEAQEKLKGTGLFDFWKEVKERSEKGMEEFNTDLAKAVYNSASIVDKIQIQQNLRNNAESVFKTLKPDGTAEQLAAWLKPFDDEIRKLQSSALELLPIWEQIFGDNQYKSFGEISKATNAAKEIVGNATVTKDENGEPVSFSSSFTLDDGSIQQIDGDIEQLDKLKEKIDELYKAGLKKNPFKALVDGISDLFKKSKEGDNNSLAKKIAKIGEAAAESAEMVGELAGQLSSMFEAMGNDGMAQSMTDVQDVMSSVSNIGKGFAEGGIVGGIASVAGEAVGWVTKLFQRHDANLQKQIEDSQALVQVMQNQYDILEKQMENFLGNAAKMEVEGYTGKGGAYGAQKQLLEGQLAELQKQRGLEEDKKNTDDDAIRDYDKQIADLQIQISNFAEEAANALYGIDLSGWAEQLGNSLVDAFAAGEDAAKAFDKTVGDIMRDVAAKMISQDLLAPMFNDLRDYLFGKDGGVGAFSDDYQLSPQEAAKMKEYIDRIKTQGIPAAQELYDKIDEATGGILSDSSASSSLSAGIQSITENTADILASYVNAVRADVSIQTNVHWPKLLNEALPQINVIAQSQLDCQRRIAEYTQRNAVAAEAIVKSNEDISRLLVRATNGGTSFYVK